MRESQDESKEESRASASRKGVDLRKVFPPDKYSIIPAHSGRRNLDGEATATPTTSGRRTKKSRTCYYGGGITCIIQTFLSVPMIVIGVEFLYDCPSAPYLPLLLLSAGTLHFMLSLPFVGLLLYAVIKATFRNIRRAKVSNVLSSVARSAANAFFSSFVGYTMDVISICIQLLIVGFAIYTIVTATDKKGRDKFASFSLKRDECHPVLLSFTYGTIVFYFVFLVFTVIIVSIGCCRGDNSRVHNIFAEGIILTEGGKLLDPSGEETAGSPKKATSKCTTTMWARLKTPKT